MRLRSKPETEKRLLSHPLVYTPKRVKPGTWNEIFGRTAPLYVELGTGKGQYLAQAAKLFPERNWLGVERAKEALIKAVRKGEQIENAPLRYLWADVKLLKELFAPQEIDQLFLHFVDPWPKKRHTKRRLTYRSFLTLYQQVLSAEGKLILKTDNQGLFTFSCEELSHMGWHLEARSEDLHHSQWAEGNLMTEYEEKYAAAGKPIYYLTARPPA